MSTGADAGPVGDLQFDRAIDHAGASPAGALLCAGCAAPIEGAYFQVGGAVACAACKDALHTAQEEAAAQARRATGFLRATGLGFAAAVAGAAIYYAVIAITEWELALVALLIGWMVGWAVRRGSHGFGGRRYQVLALLLTYFSVGLAYTPLAFKGLLAAQEKRAGITPVVTPATRADQSSPPALTTTAAQATSPAAPSSPASTNIRQATSSAAPSSPAAAPSVKAAPAGDEVAKVVGSKRVKALALLALLALLLVTILASLVLPIVFVVGSLPSGILSAVIIGVGMQQAWKMTAARPISISGPYQVGSGPAAMLRNR